MKLSLKLIAALVVAISVVMAINGLLRLDAEKALFEAQTTRELRALGGAVAVGAEMVWNRSGEGQARRFVAGIDRAHDGIDVRWTSVREVASQASIGLSPDQIQRLADGRTVSVVRDSDADHQSRLLFRPFARADADGAMLQLSTTLEAQRAFVRSSRGIMISTTAGLAIVCALIIAAAGYWFVGRPLNRLRDKARQVGQGRLWPPLVLSQKDEVGELAAEINAMCERLGEAQRTAAHAAEQRIATLEQLRHADRLRTVGQLASGVAHELGTPLNVARGNATMIRDGEATGEEASSCAAVIVEQVDRMASIVRQLLDFSRQRGPSFAAADLVELTRQTLQMLQPMADRAGVRLELQGRKEFGCEVDAAQIQQALANLVVNAIQASAPEGRVIVSVESRPAPGGAAGASGVEEAADDWAALVVTDDGPGVPEPDRARIFEPFFTTKSVGEGTGLGLSVAYGIVQEHGGDIELDSPPGCPARFRIWLPARVTELFEEAS